MSAPASIPSAPSSAPSSGSSSSAPASSTPSSTPAPSSPSATPASATPSSTPAPASSAPPTPVEAPAPRRFKITGGGGKEIEVGPDDIGRAFGGEFEALSTAMGGEENLLRLYKQRRSEQWASQQHAERARRLAAAKERAAQDPDAALQEILRDAGVELDVDSIAMQRMERKFQLEAMTPEQREVHELRQMLTARERAEKQQAEQAQQAQRAEQRRAQGVAVKGAIAELGLPESRYYFDRANLLMMQNERLPAGHPQKVEGLDAKGAASQVLSEFLGEVSWLVSALPVEKLDELFGEEVSSKYRDHAVAKFKAAPPPVPVPGSPPPTPSRDESGRFAGKAKTYREKMDEAQGWK